MKPTRIHHLDPNLTDRVKNRIRRKSDTSESGCIIWRGNLDRYGYGRFNISIDGTRKMTGAHRAAWLAWRGDIPGDLVIDHLCRNRACVNVAHMELVTNAENTRRQDHSNKAGRSGPRIGALGHACGTHGQDDGYLSKDSRGNDRWNCRICRRKWAKAWRMRQKLSA